MNKHKNICVFLDLLSSRKGIHLVHWMRLFWAWLLMDTVPAVKGILKQKF